MMGLPIVAINNQMANIIYNFDFYEVEEILRSLGGIVCGSVEEMISQTQELLDNDAYAKEISEKQRAYAIDVFGKKKIIKQWEEFLNAI
jgi:glycosyltransferase involved in cell wall biosynthesis